MWQHVDLTCVDLTWQSNSTLFNTTCPSTKVSASQHLQTHRQAHDEPDLPQWTKKREKTFLTAKTWRVCFFSFLKGATTVKTHRNNPSFSLRSTSSHAPHLLHSQAHPHPPSLHSQVHVHTLGPRNSPNRVWRLLCWLFGSDPRPLLSTITTHK